MLPNRQIKTTAAVALALGALTPAAAAMPQLDPGGATHTQTQTSPIVRVITPNSGFDWGDAGIGAGGGLALAMLGLGGTLALSHRRTPPPQPASTDQLTNQEHTHHVHA